MILVVTPLPLEMDALKAFKFDPSRFRLEVGGHGKVQFALRTLQFLQEFKPELLVCAGACGSISGAVKPLDVVVGVCTVEHDFKLKFVERPIPRFAGHGASIEKLRHINPSEFTTHFGPIASGDEDVVDGQRGSEIARTTGAVAVAWEGAGGARACLHAGVPFLEIRGVTDTADHAAISHFRTNLAPAMANVARVLSVLG